MYMYPSPSRLTILSWLEHLKHHPHPTRPWLTNSQSDKLNDNDIMMHDMQNQQNKKVCQTLLPMRGWGLGRDYTRGSFPINAHLTNDLYTKVLH